MITKLLENAVLGESAIQKCMQEGIEKHRKNITDKINSLLIEKAQELGLSLYEVCANYVPEIRSEIIEIDVYKNKREWPDMAIKNTIRLVRRD